MPFPSFRNIFGGIASETVKSEQGQLLRILDGIKSNPDIYQDVLKQVADKNPGKFKSIREAQRYFESAVTDEDARDIIKLIENTSGVGTSRILSLLDKKQDPAYSVRKILANKVNSENFEKQVENGYYLNLLETYGVEWNLEKVSRDVLQNFFDANGQTLDGVDIKTGVEGKMDPESNTKIKTGRVLIQAPQDYDWRELIHFGGTTKQDSETAVGGFGEGLKIAAFVLLKEQGAKQVKVASRDWELEYYFDDVKSEAYRKPVKGLYAEKHKRNKDDGNYIEIIFEGDDADKKVKAFEGARELFYSSENPDFQGASFDNKASGGFTVLPPRPSLVVEGSFNNLSGHLYLAGQRIHFNNRDMWETVSDMHIWTWKKVQPKDRDRGMITSSEFRNDVLPMIIDSMSPDDLKKSVYDFKPLWDKFSPFSQSSDLLEGIVGKLEKAGIILNFEKEYIANDLPFGASWIQNALVDKGFKMCKSYMKKVGMKGAVDQFKEWQSHNKVEIDQQEAKKIELLQKTAEELGLPQDELKEVWIFSAENESSAVSGQYNPMFYWMSREALKKSFLDALHTYVHEAAHKDGPHGDPKFEYGLQARIQKIQKFILEHKDKWDEFERGWELSSTEK